MLMPMLLLAAAAQAGGVVTEMTPERIQEAIAYGAQQKKVDLPLVKAGPARCVLSTPYLRVARAASEAKRKYKTFAAADVDDEMKAPTVHVVCSSVCVVPDCSKSYGFASVQTIVITDKGGAGPTQPLKAEPMPVTYSNAFGAHDEAEGLLAIFPMAALQPGRELHIVLDKKAHGMTSQCQDCKADVKLEGLH
jgi:hypothetical protein